MKQCLIGWWWNLKPKASKINSGFQMLGPLTILTHCGQMKPYALWQQRPGSRLDQVMACCPMTPSHDLNQYWLLCGIHQRVITQTLYKVLALYDTRFICCMRWGHPSLFDAATSLLSWYKMACMANEIHRLIWVKFMSMLLMYVQPGTHRHFHWRVIAVLTQNPAVLMFVDITGAS